MLVTLYFFFLYDVCFGSQNYLIPSYYGSKDKDFLLRDSILNGNLSSVYWHPNIAKNPTSGIFYVGYQNAIFEIDSNNRSIIIAGTLSSKGGYRDGDSNSALFNTITSIIYFQKNETLAEQEYSKKTIILSNNSTECLNVDYQNYTSCLDSTSDPIDPYLIKDIYQDVTANQTTQNEFLFIVDSGNHCIRKIDLQQQITSTIAGICGEAGFKDGPLQISQFDSPDQMGIDSLGNLFVNDFGNHFIRMIDTDFQVVTLLSGSCREDVRYLNQLTFDNLVIKRVICLKNWVKTSGEPSDHLLTIDFNICTNQISDCN